MWMHEVIMRSVHAWLINVNALFLTQLALLLLFTTTTHLRLSLPPPTARSPPSSLGFRLPFKHTGA